MYYIQAELEKKGYIYKGKHEGWYAVSDEAFYASNQVQETIDEKTGEKIMVCIINSYFYSID